MRYFLLAGTMVLPGLLCAQTTLTSIVSMFTGVINTFIGAAVAVALLVFIWGITTTMIGMNSGASGSEKAITEGKKRMVWGVVGLFVIVSIWGIISLLAQTFGVSLTNPDQAAPVIETN